MSGRGEQPEEDGDAPTTDVPIGMTLYTEHGDPVGTVRGIEEGGVFVTLRDDIEGLALGHARAGHTFGSGELVWRCMDCGAMGDLDDDLPESCPDCDAPREALMYWTED